MLSNTVRTVQSALTSDLAKKAATEAATAATFVVAGEGLKRAARSVKEKASRTSITINTVEEEEVTAS